MADMSAYQIFNAEVIAPSGVATSAAINIGRSTAIAIHITALGGVSPDIDFSYSLSTNQDGPFIVPVVSPASFPQTVGAPDVFDVSPEAAGWMKVIATEAGGANTATLTAVLAIQDLE